MKTFEESLADFRSAGLTVRAEAIALIGHSITKKVGKRRWQPSGVAQEVRWETPFDDGGLNYTRLRNDTKITDPNSILGGGYLTVQAAAKFLSLWESDLTEVIICGGSPKYLDGTGQNEATPMNQALQRLARRQRIALPQIRMVTNGKTTQDDVRAIFMWPGRKASSRSPCRPFRSDAPGSPF